MSSLLAHFEVIWGPERGRYLVATLATFEDKVSLTMACGVLEREWCVGFMVCWWLSFLFWSGGWWLIIPSLFYYDPTSMEEEEGGNEPVYFEEALNHQQVHAFFSQPTFSHFFTWPNFSPFSLGPLWGGSQSSKSSLHTFCTWITASKVSKKESAFSFFPMSS